ncbi:MAG: outer membrane protein assembly factor BamE [Alphaproteobacteria bacterium]
MLVAFAGALAVSACTGTRDYRGFVVQEDVLAQVRLGLAKSEVERLLGSPSATSTIRGKNYYYISSVFETNTIYEPEEIDRRVIAINFDEQDMVRNIADYRLQDGKVFDFISRKTPTRGKELSFLQQLFGNIGKFGGSGTGLSSAAKPGGS